MVTNVRDKKRGRKEGGSFRLSRETRHLRREAMTMTKLHRHWGTPGERFRYVPFRTVSDDVNSVPSSLDVIEIIKHFFVRQLYNILILKYFYSAFEKQFTDWNL